jgi:phenylalanyl-tRNA synthetase beta chain
MKLPLSWLREFVEVDASADEIAHRLSVAGLVVESIERTSPRFSGVVVAKVLEAGRHPNADRLSLCQVDAGPRGRFSVVCGAPNVRTGMTAALAMVGARLAGAGKGHAGAEQRVEDAPPLEAAVIRGVRSEGMLCSERELALSAEHGGILALPDDAPIGHDVADYLHLADTVLDVEITPNRGDCLSILGLARDVAALFGAPLRPRRPRRAPASRAGALVFSVDIGAPDLCPRYAALPMSGVKLGQSPMWMRRRLELCGMRALNNVVDATNYVMLELGQPLHAFDLDKIDGGRIVVRRAHGDREFITLDGVTRTLEADDLMIADGAKPLAIAGVMGGLNSEVGESTTTILLESAYFTPAAISKVSRRLGLRSEASYRFERGIDRAGQPAALARAAELIAVNAGGKIAGALVDIDAQPAPHREIALKLDAMASLLGVAIKPEVVRRRLKSLGARVSAAGRGTLKVVPPPWRPDLNESADLAEEVARLSGLEDIPSVLPPRISALAPYSRERAFFAGTREVLIGAGLTEAMTIAFIAPAENQRYPGLAANPAAVRVQNPLSAELGEMRLSLMPGLVAALRFNLNREAASFHAFEIGKVFAMEGDVARERQRLGAITYGPYVRGSIGEPGVAAGFFTIKGIVESYLGALGLAERVSMRAADPGRVPFLHPGRAADVMLDDSQLGYLGELHPSDAMRLGLNTSCAVCELDLTSLLSYGFAPRKPIEAPPRFPAVRRDLALVVDRDLPADSVIRTLWEVASPMLEDVEVFDVYEGTAVAQGKKSIALACRYRSKDRTLTDEEVNLVHAALVEQACTRLGAEMRR